MRPLLLIAPKQRRCTPALAVVLTTNVDARYVILFSAQHAGPEVVAPPIVATLARRDSRTCIVNSPACNNDYFSCASLSFLVFVSAVPWHAALPSHDRLKNARADKGVRKWHACGLQDGGALATEMLQAK